MLGGGWPTGSSGHLRWVLMWLPRRSTRLLVGALVALTTAGCSGSSHAASSACAAGKVATKKAGTLTLATGAITRTPWVTGPSAKEHANDPRPGTGYDAAVGYELAHRLGFDRDHVVWKGLGFFETLRSGSKPFDIGINQATITTERRRDVDLSSPYWVERPVLVSLTGRAVTKVSRLADLASTPLAVVRGTPAESLTQLTLDPVQNLDKAREAVTSWGVEGLVTDYNTGLRLDQTETELVNGTLVGLLPSSKDPAGFGLVLQKGSALTSCVDVALAAMRSDGTLHVLEKRWLIDELGFRDLS